MSNPLAALVAPQKFLIVAPDAFLAAVEPLVAHKNATGMPTSAVSISSLRSYFGSSAAGAQPPIDDAQIVKLAICYAFEKLGTAYVLLVGDSQNFPVRYWFSSPWGTPTYPNTNVKIPATPNGGFVQSDLYYANLFHHAGVYPNLTPNGFDYWDSAIPGLYNQGDGSYPNTEFNPDNVDGYPDLALARLPAASDDEVTAYVNKVIAYETNHVAPQAPVISFVHDKQYGSLGLSLGLAQALTGVGAAASWMGYRLIENYPNTQTLAGLGETLYLAYIAEDGGGGLEVASLPSNATTWAKSNPVGQKSVTGPALIAFSGSPVSPPTLWLAFVAYSQGGSGEIQLVSSLDGKTWGKPIPTGQFSKETPALAHMGETLFLSYVVDDDSDQIYVLPSRGGTSWTTRPAPVPGQNSCAAPALAVFQPASSSAPLLWMAFVTNDPTNKVFICSSPDGVNWAAIQQVSATPPSASAPALAVFDGQLFLAYAAAGSYELLVTSSPDGVNWAPAAQIPGQKTRSTPSLAVFGGKLYAGFRGDTSSSLFTCVLAPGAGQSWSGHSVLPFGSALAPSPFVSTAHTDLAAALSKSFFVSYIGHGGAGGWGHIELFSEADISDSAWTMLPIVFAAACQTTLFAANTPWGTSFTDVNGNPRGPFLVSQQAAPGVAGLVATEGYEWQQSWGAGPGFTQTAPPNSLSGKWALPVDIPSPNVYNSAPMDCIGKTWVIDAAPGGAIAYFGVHDVAIPDPDIEMERYLLTNYIKAATDTPPKAGGPLGECPVLGDLYLAAQRTYWNAHRNDADTAGLSDYHTIPRLYLGWLAMFGDPSLRLAPITSQCAQAVQFFETIIKDRGPALPVSIYDQTKALLEKCVADGDLSQADVDALLSAYAAAVANWGKKAP